MAAPAPAVGGVAWSAAWDAGPLALGHQMIGNRCEACHQAPFQRVQDAACVKCHVPTATPDHVSPVAAKAGVTLGTRCAECHRDHRGEHALVRTDPVLCVDCHRNIKALYPSTRLAAISDFGSNHSPFALSMVNAASGRIEKVFPGAPGFAGEASGLKFPHATHMAKKGIRTPTGVRVLECSQCHKLDGAGERFEPIRMEGNCSECHRLEFEPAATTRQVPHGKPLEILTALREFYSGIAVGETPIDVTLVNDLLRRPVAEPGRTERVRARAWADQKALSVATDLVERRVCVQCHQVSREAGLTLVSAGAEPGWTIQPVRITSHWLPGSAFGHKAHQQAACEKCHDVQSSRVSADIAIPDLASCRSCHGGTTVTPGKLTSPCETCHSFHQHGKPGVRPPTPMVVASLAAPGVAGSR
jgi:predicted CXXCH cytochrome family protein